MVVALLAAAAVAHAAWNLSLKKTQASGFGSLWLAFLVGTIVYLPLGIMSLVSSGVPLARLALLAVGSGILQLAYFLLLQRGYRLGDVSVVYPLARGTGPLLSVVFAIILFGEVPTLLGLAGAALIIVGVVVIGATGGRARFRDNRAGIVYGLLVGVMIAAYTLWDANAILVQKLPPIGYYWVALVVQLALFSWPALRSATATLAIARRSWLPVVIVGVLSPLAYVLVLFAYRLAPVSIVAPAREVSVVLVVLAGWLLFREPHPRVRLLGAVVVLGGVALLALS